MARYNPQTRVVTRERPLRTLVNMADPDFERRKHREVEYPFTARNFTADPYNRGAYNHRSNVYPVGQSYGGLDDDVVNNMPLYSGIPKGGWA